MPVSAASRHRLCSSPPRFNPLFMTDPHTAWSPFLRASVGVHAAALVLPVFVPGAWPWSVGALVANHALITAAGLWPRSNWLGPNLTRLPEAAARRGEVAVTIDDGPDPEVTPAVLDQLREHGALATFFCIAERARRHPELVQRIVAEGHSVQNHSLRHRHHFSLLGPAGFARELSAAQDVLGELTGARPRFFRAPAGLRNPFLQPVLARQGLLLTSWTRRGYDTRERDPSRVLGRLCGGLAAGDILLLHDGHAARAADGRAVVLHVLPALLRNLHRQRLYAVTLDQALRPAPGAHAVNAHPRSAPSNTCSAP